MELGKVYKEYRQNGRVRLCAEALYDSAEKDVFCFEYPAGLADSIVESGDPWLVLFLSISVVLGETLRITRPVDPLLLEGCLEVLEVWNCCMPHLPIIDVEAEKSAHRI